MRNIQTEQSWTGLHLS